MARGSAGGAGTTGPPPTGLLEDGPDGCLEVGHVFGGEPFGPVGVAIDDGMQELRVLVDVLDDAR